MTKKPQIESPQHITSKVVDEATLKDIRHNTNLTIWFSIIIMFVSAIVNYLMDYSYSYFIVTITLITLLVSAIFITPKYPSASRYILVIASHVCIVLLNLVEGVVAGNYFYLFIFLIIAIFIYDYSEKRQIIFTYLLTVSCLLFIFTIAPFHSSLQPIGSEDEKMTFIFNVFISISFTILLSIRLLKRNFDHLRSTKDREQFLNTIYNSSLDAVFIVDTEKMAIQSCNHNSLKLFDTKSFDDLIGKSMSDLFAHNEEEQLIISKIKSDLVWQGEADCITAHRFVFPGYVSIVPFESKGAALKKISILDISAMRQVQNQLLDAKTKAEEAVKVKSRFLSNMSHELRTPLNGIIGTANLLLQEEDYPASLNSHFELLKYSSEHMLGLVNDVLDFSKIEAGKMDLNKESFNLNELMQQLWSMFQRQFEEKGLLLDWSVDPHLNRNFIGDTIRIGQVLSNIISNAHKFTATGKVSVYATLLRSTSTVSSIQFKVIDTGIGIPEHKHELIFDSFSQADTATTRKFGGTGLGLAISKKIVELYNGKLQVKNNEFGGSCFYFTIDLEISQQHSNFIKDKNDLVLPPIKGLRLLIAEDNVINMKIAVRFMEKWQVTPVQAVNGKKALEVFTPHSFDLLLVDLEMPEMDGYELVQEIKKIDSQVPVIAFTAAVYDNMLEDLNNKGFTDYLQKPFRPADLHKKILKYAPISVDVPQA